MDNMDRYIYVNGRLYKQMYFWNTNIDTQCRRF